MNADDSHDVRTVSRPWYRGKPVRKVQAVLDAIWHDYPHRNLFIAALPKSGSTWLARMAASIPGYREWIPAYVTETDHTVKRASFAHLPIGYTVTKLHCKPTPEHLAVFNGLGRPYVVIIRDLRDVVVSGYYYLRNVSAHENAVPFRTLEPEEGLDKWMREKLADRVAWIDGWREGMDARLGLMIRYEQLLSGPLAGFATICRHYEINLSNAQLQRIVEQHSFKKATGRAPGQADATSFNRKGIAGDWRNHFTPALRETFKSLTGEALVRWGYESDSGW
jgi:hypothetical protein